MRPLLSRDQLIALSGLTIAVGLAWGYLFELSQNMYAMPDMAMPAPPAAFTTTIGMWIVMMIGMMLPSATPMILLFAAEQRRRRDRGPLVTTGAFAAGYLTVWGAFAVVAAALQVSLTYLEALSPSLALGNTQLVALTLMAASVYELSPVKKHFLKLCSVQPLHFVREYWSPGIVGAVREGVIHGCFCLGCCLVLMLLLFVFGVMNLFWIAVLSVIVLLQKLLPYNLLTTTASGAVIGSIAVAVFVVPDWLSAIQNPDFSLLPFAAGLAGVLFIAVVAAVDVWGQELSEANVRQDVLFPVTQKPSTDTLHLVLGTVELAERHIDAAPAQARIILHDAMRRISASAEVYRRLNDPSLFSKGLKPILHDVLSTIIDSRSIRLSVEMDELDLRYEQMAVITMAVIELANNAQKHVFGQHLGTGFFVSVRGLPHNFAVLSVKDDGPGWSPADTSQHDAALGLRILQDLAGQLRGKLTINADKGTQVTVIFPTGTLNSMGS